MNLNQPEARVNAIPDGEELPILAGRVLDTIPITRSSSVVPI